MNETVTQLVDFRENIHQSIPYRSDATMELIDAIAGNTSAQSPVALSLNSLFHRQYSSLHDAVDNFFVPGSSDKSEFERREQQLQRMRIAAGYYPEPTRHNFYQFGLDTTTQPRPFAHTLKDRGIHYYPNPAPGNKPIIVGHSYSVLAGLPEKENKTSPPWVIPLLIRRVPTDKKATEVGAAQLDDLLKDKELPFGSHLSSAVGDSTYSSCEFIGQVVNHKNLATNVRVRGNRKFYRIPQKVEEVGKGQGHPTWYGTPFKMKDSSTWDEADGRENFPFTFRNGRVCQIEMQTWYNMLMRGKRDIPMHEHPFTLIRVVVKDSDGKMVFNRPLWLTIHGERRHEISLSDAYEAYRQRYDLEHFFRFGKNRLLMASYQSPDVEHEENWWEIVGLAYVELYIAAPLANSLPRPWERYLPQVNNSSGQLTSPSMVQRDLSRIIQGIESPVWLPKPRGKSPGRTKGYSPGRRERLPVVKKGKKDAPKSTRSP